MSIYMNIEGGVKTLKTQGKDKPTNCIPLSPTMEKSNINFIEVLGLQTEEALKCSDGSLPPSAFLYT